MLENFADIEGDARSFMRTEYHRFGATLIEETEQAAEWANERGFQFWALLDELRKQTFLGALAGCFHQWEKELRDFLEKELSHDFESNKVKKIVWSNTFADVYDVLKEYGWDCSASKFFARLEACRLIVNVYKHGKGSSLDKLAKSHPEYLSHSFGSASSLPYSGAPDHKRLEVSGVQFDEIVTAIRSFWEAFPERLFLN